MYVAEDIGLDDGAAPNSPPEGIDLRIIMLDLESLAVGAGLAPKRLFEDSLAGLLIA